MEINDHKMPKTLIQTLIFSASVFVNFGVVASEMCQRKYVLQYIETT